MGTESIFGFGLLTASVSWILSIYPVLEHRKSLAHEASLMHFAEMQGIRRLRDVSEADLHDILLGFASQMTDQPERVDSVSDYVLLPRKRRGNFAGGNSAVSGGYRGAKCAWRRSRGLAATALGGAIDDYLKFVSRTFLDRPFTSRYELLGAFAADHLRDAVRSPA